MKDSIVLETIHDRVHDRMEVFIDADGDTHFWMKDQPAHKTFHMWLDLENTANLRDFLDYLLKGTKFDPDQNIT